MCRFTVGEVLTFSGCCSYVALLEQVLLLMAQHRMPATLVANLCINLWCQVTYQVLTCRFCFVFIACALQLHLVWLDLLLITKSTQLIFFFRYEVLILHDLKSITRAYGITTSSDQLEGHEWHKCKWTDYSDFT